MDSLLQNELRPRHHTCHAHNICIADGPLQAAGPSLFLLRQGLDLHLTACHDLLQENDFVAVEFYAPW